ncbi:MAG: NADH-quinone oxidoreductase subunit M [Phycisphaerae bacterium]
MLTDHVLTILIFMPAAGAVATWLMPAAAHAAIRRNALLVSLATLGVAIAATMLFYGDRHVGPSTGGAHLVERHAWIGDASTDTSAALRVQYLVGVDGISLPLVLLTALLTPLAIAASFSAIRERVREYYSLLLLLHAAMLGVFCARDLLLFYVFFEFTLIPLYLLIGIWGGDQRRKAADTFFIYTLAGSVLTFAGVLYLGWQAFIHLTDPVTGARVLTFEFDQLYRLAAEGHLSHAAQSWLFLALFAGFAIKVPLFPLHTWLPLAHTEAPTAGSAILAGVLLKLGTYGFLRLSLPMLPAAVQSAAPVVAGLCIVGIIYGALAAWVQTDIKKLVAYSSVSHLGFCILGLFSLKLAGLTGALVYMANHGLSTGALFLVVGMIYERYHTREMAELGGLARRMPWLAFFLIFFTLSSVGLPGLNGFVGEFFVLLGTFTSAHAADGAPPGPLGPIYAVLAATGVVLGAIYMFHLCRAVLFGPLREPTGHHAAESAGAAPHLPADLSRREIALLVPLAAACLWIGVAPAPLFDLVQPPLNRQVLARAVARPAMRTTDAVAVVAPRAIERHPEATAP